MSTEETSIHTDLNTMTESAGATKEITVRPEEDIADAKPIPSTGNIVDELAAPSDEQIEIAPTTDVYEQEEFADEQQMELELEEVSPDVFTGEQVEVAGLNFKDLLSKFSNAARLKKANKNTVFNPNKLSSDPEVADQIEGLAKQLNLNKYEKISYKDIADSLNKSGYEYDQQFVKEIMTKVKNNDPTIADPYTIFKEFHFLSSVGKETQRLAKEVLDLKSANKMDKNKLVEFQHMLTLEGNLARRLKGQQVDIARSLGILSQVRKPGGIKMIDDVLAEFDEASSNLNPLRNSDGASVIEEIAEKYLNAESTTRRKIAEGNSRGIFRRFARITSNVYTTGLVSNEKTHARNILGFVSLSQMVKAENLLTWGFGRVRERLSKFNELLPEKIQFDPSDRMRFKQVLEEGRIHYELIGEAFSNFWNVARHNKVKDRAAKFDYENPVGKGDFDDLTGKEPLDRMFKFLGTSSTYHGRLLTAEDEAMKTFGFGAKVKSEGLRRKLAERDSLIAQGMDEDAAEEAAAKFFDDLMKDPPEDMLQNAVEHSRYLTHTQDLEGLLASLERGSQNPFLKVWAPFFKVTTNLTGSIFERSVFAPLLPYSRFYKNLQAGGQKADAAMARFTTGASLQYYFMSLALDGRVTGALPYNTKDRMSLINQGVLPFAFVFRADEFSEEQKKRFEGMTNVSVGKGTYSDRIYVSYQGIEPLSVMMAMGATAGEYAQLNPDNYTMENLLIGGGLAAYNYLDSHPLLSGMTKVVDTIQIMSKDAEESKEQAVAQLLSVYQDYLVHGFPNAGLPSEIPLDKVGIDAKIPTTPYSVEIFGEKHAVGGAWSSWWAGLETMNSPTRTQIKQPLDMQDKYNTSPFTSKYLEVLQRSCSRNPMCSDKLPPVLDPLTGRERRNGAGNLYDKFSPFVTSEGLQIGAWTVITEYNVGDPQLHKNYGTIDGVKLSDDQFNRLIKFATKNGQLERNIIKYGEVASKRKLDKAQVSAGIKKLISDAYGSAKSQLIKSDPALRRRIQEYKELDNKAINSGQSINKILVRGEDQ